MHKLVMGAVVILILGIGVAGLYWSNHNSSEKYTGPTQKVLIGNVEGYPNLALIAEEKGYFDEYGLDITFRNYATAPSIIEDLRAGKINLVSASAEFLVARNSFTTEDLKILATVSKQDNYWEIIARRDKNIHSIEDLKSKKIGLSVGTIGEFLWGRFLTLNNLDKADVETIDIEQNERIKQIIQGEIDAVILLSPYTERLKKTLGENAIFWSVQSGRDIFSVSYTTESFSSQQQDVLTHYLRALAKTEVFVQNNETEARTIMQSKLKFNDDDIGYIWPHFTFELGLEQELLITMEDEARWMIENKLVNKTKVPNYLNFIYFNGLEKVKPEAINIIR